MKLSGDLQFKLLVGAVAVGGVLYAVYRLYGGIAHLIPQTVKDGAQAAGLMATTAANAVIHPLDTFGIVPADKNGQTTWTQTTPWEANYPVEVTSNNDPVSNNAGGINYNLF